MIKEHKESSLAIDENCLLVLHCEDYTDSSLVARTVTNNSSSIVTGKFNNGISAALSNFFYTAFVDALKWSTQDYTIDMWVYNTALLSTANSNTHGTNVCCGNSPNGVDYFSFGLTQGKVTFYYYSGSQKYLQGVTVASLNAWHHIAMTHKNGTIKLYLDGVLEVTASVSGTPQYATTYGLRFLSTGTSILDEIRISNVCRYDGNFTPPEIEYL